jgi:hypothetical protein
MPEMELPREEVMALYASGFERLAAALSGLSESDLDVSIAPGEWTVRQIVHHLADGEDTFSMALKMALGAPGSVFTFDWYPGNEEWGAELGHADRAIGPALGMFKAHREVMVQLLDLIPDGWDRHVTFVSARGQPGREVKAGAILDMLARHLVAHAEEIEKARAKHGLQTRAGVARGWTTGEEA